MSEFTGEIPSLDPDEDPVWCTRCRDLKKQIAQLESDYQLNYTTLKQKIISTDQLIKRYSSKCQEYDVQTKRLEEANKTLDKYQRDCESLENQLKSTLQEFEPLKKAKKKLEDFKHRLEPELQAVKDKLAASEMLCSQYEKMSQERVVEEDKNVTKKIQSLEQSLKKKDDTINKMKDDMSSCRSDLNNEKKTNKRLASKIEKQEVLLAQLQDFIKRNGLSSQLKGRGLRRNAKTGTHDIKIQGSEDLSQDDENFDEVLFDEDTNDHKNMDILETKDTAITMEKNIQINKQKSQSTTEQKKIAIGKQKNRDCIEQETDFSGFGEQKTNIIEQKTDFSSELLCMNNNIPKHDGESVCMKDLIHRDLHGIDAELEDMALDMKNILPPPLLTPLPISDSEKDSSCEDDDKANDSDSLDQFANMLESEFRKSPIKQASPQLRRSPRNLTKSPLSPSVMSIMSPKKLKNFTDFLPLGKLEKSIDEMSDDDGEVIPFMKYKNRKDSIEHRKKQITERPKLNRQNQIEVEKKLKNDFLNDFDISSSSSEDEAVTKSLDNMKRSSKKAETEKAVSPGKRLTRSKKSIDESLDMIHDKSQDDEENETHFSAMPLDNFKLSETGRFSSFKEPQVPNARRRLRSRESVDEEFNPTVRRKTKSTNVTGGQRSLSVTEDLCSNLVESNKVKTRDIINEVTIQDYRKPTKVRRVTRSMSCPEKSLVNLQTEKNEVKNDIPMISTDTPAKDLVSDKMVNSVDYTSSHDSEDNEEITSPFRASVRRRTRSSSIKKRKRTLSELSSSDEEVSMMPNTRKRSLRSSGQANETESLNEVSNKTKSSQEGSFKNTSVKEASSKTETLKDKSPKGQSLKTGFAEIEKNINGKVQEESESKELECDQSTKSNKNSDEKDKVVMDITKMSPTECDGVESGKRLTRSMSHENAKEKAIVLKSKSLRVGGTKSKDENVSLKTEIKTDSSQHHKECSHVKSKSPENKRISQLTEAKADVQLEINERKDSKNKNQSKNTHDDRNYLYPQKRKCSMKGSTVTSDTQGFGVQLQSDPLENRRLTRTQAKAVEEKRNSGSSVDNELSDMPVSIKNAKTELELTGKNQTVISNDLVLTASNEQLSNPHTCQPSTTVSSENSGILAVTSMSASRSSSPSVNSFSSNSSILNHTEAKSPVSPLPMSPVQEKSQLSPLPPSPEDVGTISPLPESPSHKINNMADAIPHLSLQPLLSPIRDPPKRSGRPSSGIQLTSPINPPKPLLSPIAPTPMIADPSKMPCNFHSAAPTGVLAVKAQHAKTQSSKNLAQEFSASAMQGGSNEQDISSRGFTSQAAALQILKNQSDAANNFKHQSKARKGSQCTTTVTRTTNQLSDRRNSTEKLPKNVTETSFRPVAKTASEKGNEYNEQRSSDRQIIDYGDINQKRNYEKRKMENEDSALSDKPVKRQCIWTMPKTGEITEPNPSQPKRPRPAKWGRAAQRFLNTYLSTSQTPLDLAHKLKTEIQVRPEKVLERIRHTLETLESDQLPVLCMKCSQGSLKKPVLSDEEHKLVALVVNLDKLEYTKNTLEEQLKLLYFAILSPSPRKLTSTCGLCRFFTALCLESKNLDYVRVLVYNIIQQKHYGTCQLFTCIAGVWPRVLEKNLFDSSPVLEVMEYILMKNSESENKYRKCLSALCNWSDPPLNAVSLANQLLFKARQETEKGKDCVAGILFEVQKSLELLSIYETWEWTNNSLIRELLWPVLQEWGANKQKKQLEKLVAFALTLIGLVSSHCPPTHKESVVEIMKTLYSLLNSAKQTKVPWCVQSAAFESLLLLSPYCPELVSASCNTWGKIHLPTIPVELRNKMRQFYDFFGQKIPTLVMPGYLSNRSLQQKKKT